MDSAGYFGDSNEKWFDLSDKHSDKKIAGSNSSSGVAQNQLNKNA